MNPAPVPFKELLEGATQGPWTTDTDDLGTWLNTPAHPAPIAKMGKCTHFDARANAAYIARCNPATMAVVWEALNDARHWFRQCDLRTDTIDRAIALLNGTGGEEKL